MITQSAVRDLEKNRKSESPRILPVRLTDSQQYYLTLLHSLSLQIEGVEQPLTTLGITSCYRREGVSTIAAHLAMAAAFTGKRVLLVDLNWKRPSVHQTFSVSRGPGLSEALASEGREELPLQASPVSHLSLLTIGEFEGDYNLLTSHEKMARLIRSLREDYELVVFDLPESAEAGTSLSLSRLLEGVLLVIEAERVRWEVALRVKKLLMRSGANVLGTVLNKRRQHIPNWLYRTL